MNENTQKIQQLESKLKEANVRLSELEQLTPSTNSMHNNIYDNFFKDSIDCVQVVDRNGLILRANSSTMSMLGYEEQELIGKSLETIINKALFENIFSIISLKQIEVSFKTDTQIIRKNGKKIQVELSIIKDDPKTWRYIIIQRENAVVDQLQEELNHKVQELDTIYNNVPLIMYIVDRKHRIVKLNAEAKKLSSDQEASPIGTRGGEEFRCVNAFDNPRGCGYSKKCKLCGIKKAISDCFKTGQSQNRIQSKFVYNDIEKTVTIYFLVTTTIIELYGAEHVLVCLEDVTERRKAEKSLIQSEMKYRDIFQHSPVGLFQTKIIDGTVIECNQQFKEMFGFKERSEIVGIVKTKDFYVNSEDRKSMIKHVTDKHQFYTYEIELKNKLGHKFWARVSERILVQRKCFEGVIEDITERKKFEIEVQSLNETLEQKVVDRTALLDDALTELIFENKERRRTQIELEKSNQAKDKYFSILAHDLKNPLSALLTSTEILKLFFQKGNLDKIETHINRINKSVLNLADLLNDVLAWARSQSGLIEYNPVFFDMQELVDNTIELSESAIANKKLQVKIEIADKYEVYADQNMISAVMRNLISNAIKFTPAKGQVKIYIVAQDGNLECSVSDTGIGISPKNIETIFQVDSQYRAKGTNGESGTGLGLILCKDFIEKHSGKIWVESTIGHGSTIYFNLPKVQLLK